MYAAMDGAVPRVDFWWLRPDEKAPAQLQPESLNRHATGYFKNAPGQSRAVYAPLADLFGEASEMTAGLLNFRVVRGAGGAARAVIECAQTDAQYVLVLAWQEDWSTPLSRSRRPRCQLHSAGSSIFPAPRPMRTASPRVTRSRRLSRLPLSLLQRHQQTRRWSFPPVTRRPRPSQPP